MFGYIRAYKPYMRMFEYEIYKSVYCGICKDMHRRFGFMTRMTLTYDSAFLALIDLSVRGKKLKVRGERCIAHPWKKSMCAVCGSDLSYASSVSVLLTYHKLKDDIADKGFKKKALAAILLPFFKKPYRQLCKKYKSLSDEIAVHEYIDVTEEELERVLTVLQGFDPPGIGAQSLQQCLQIQILHRKPTPVTKLMHTVVSDYWNDFSHKHWQRIADAMQMSEATAEEVFREIRRLNPRPGASLGEAMGRSTEQVIPDFIITWDDDEVIRLAINKGKVPRLRVSRDFEELIDTYRQSSSTMTRTDKEALLYAQQKVYRARSYIEAIEQRRHTMMLTMQVVIRLQRKYILSGDDSDLRPMKLKDVADIAGVDLSTVSRVCSTKYVQLPWGIIRAKQFFSAKYDVGGGEEVSTREIKNTLQDIIDQEDKKHPLSDIRIAAELKKKGYPIARRTVAKYREQLGIPIAALRK